MSGTANLKGWAAVILSVAVAGCLLAILVTTKPAEAASRYRIVTKTFTNSSAITIPSAGVADPYPSELLVSGLRRGSIRDVNLKLNGFGHSYPEDVNVLLVGPRGQNALVMSDVGGLQNAVSDINLTLDDAATNPLPDHGAIAAGTYKPTKGTTAESGEGEPGPSNFDSPAPAGPYGTNLAVFNATNPNGTWELYVLDDTGAEFGQFAGGWGLTIKARVRR